MTLSCCQQWRLVTFPQQTGSLCLLHLKTALKYSKKEESERHSNNPTTNKYKQQCLKNSAAHLTGYMMSKTWCFCWIDFTRRCFLTSFIQTTSHTHTLFFCHNCSNTWVWCGYDQFIEEFGIICLNLSLPWSRKHLGHSSYKHIWKVSIQTQLWKMSCVILIVWSTKICDASGVIITCMLRFHSSLFKVELISLM